MPRQPLTCLTWRDVQTLSTDMDHCVPVNKTRYVYLCIHIHTYTYTHRYMGLYDIHSNSMVYRLFPLCHVICSTPDPRDWLVIIILHTSTDLTALSLSSPCPHRAGLPVCRHHIQGLDWSDYNWLIRLAPVRERCGDRCIRWDWTEQAGLGVCPCSAKRAGSRCLTLWSWSGSWSWRLNRRTRPFGWDGRGTFVVCVRVSSSCWCESLMFSHKTDGSMLLLVHVPVVVCSGASWHIGVCTHRPCEQCVCPLPTD